MGTQDKRKIKTLMFWESLIAGALILALVVLMIVKRPERRIADAPSRETESSDTTEGTLPPPDANPIGVEDIAQDGAYLTCLTAPSVVGIDVSEWQGDIDWSQVKAAGIEFVMIRTAWRGYESGKMNVDAFAQRNYEGATAAGLKVGAYVFSQATTVKEAQDEATFLLDIIKNWQLDMPVVFDWECDDAKYRTYNIDARTATDCAKAFCDKIVAADYTPMVYFSTSQSEDCLHLRELTDYGLWLAQYNTTLDYPYKVDMWQYTKNGTVPGIKGNVDINLYFPWEE